jgi:hypothetical protein
MKRFLSVSAFLAVVLILVSWGYKGHRAVATIAQKHLTSNTAYVVSVYLKGESMADVSTWADENKNRITAPWHFLNLPLGLTHEQFVQAVSTSDNNVYTAILKTEASLKDNTLSFDEKNEALKYLIHLVGDAHQPMHVSRKEDKGGNTIQVRFDNTGTNLHSLWDGKLIDHEGFSQEDIGGQYDKATAEQIKKWQADSPMEWLWESYQISSRLYAETKPGQTIDDVYYKKYIPVIHQRIDQAGIRLAGELNRIFINEKVKTTSVTLTHPPPVKNLQVPVKLEEAKNLVGSTVTTGGKVYGTKDIGSMVLVNLGAAYPNQLLTLALKGDAKSLAAQIDGKYITVTGTVIDYKGKPEIVITDVGQITIKQ